MIDIESDIFKVVAETLRKKFTGIAVCGETIHAPAAFPCVCIEEADNYADRNTQDSVSCENHADLMYEINVYSNKTSGKKAECKAIFGTVDEILTNIGFTRIMTRPVSLDDGTKYRMIGRYTAVVSKNKTIYRR